MVARTVYFDDLDPDAEIPATRTAVEFSIDGKPYEIDLSEQHYAELREALEPFVAAARRLSGNNLIQMPRQRREAMGEPDRKPARMDPAQSKAIREWGRRNGFKVSDRGRIPEPLLEAYNNRDPRSGKPAANEVAERVQEPTFTEPTVEKRYAATKEEFREAALAWGRAHSMQIAERGFGLAPSVVKRFSEETGLYPPEKESKAG